ncbi:MAG: hypothetical protein VX686_01895 [Candidatus Thermoplasmatota archaeon]|nr:hypothetical protein [Candidatus Thermoplasmatota archaeon]
MGETLKVGLHMTDFGLLHQVVAALEGNEFRLQPLNRVPTESQELDVIISDAAQLPTTNLAVISINNIELLPLQLRHVQRGRPALIIGIDPGGTTGIAVLAQRRLLYSAECATPDEAAELVRRVARYSLDCTVRIGSGASEIGSRITSALRHLRIEIVDETRTGSGSHTAAARAIALRRGERLRQLDYKPSNGEVARLQAESRLVSGGLRTISRIQARRVLLGELTLEEALHN